ncbi:NERD domain-containing protein [Nocardia sp. R7R-8]|uniref:NERD domain-containing protein n=1 Tax=Nocardia sp. R7R-8 TaxID=3459304 RepID=UPI00403E01FE
MLVINERTTAPRSEQRVLGWMRTWTGQYVIVGLAISGCYLPDRERNDETQEADLVVITPRAAVVVEVKGTVPEATSGVLSVQANGRWRLSGYAGDPIHVRDHDSSPFDQVTNNVFNLKALVRKHNAEAFVDGLIVVVPPKDSNLTLNIESRRRGCAVVLGAGQADLRAWFHRTASRKLSWTAERTHALLTDLNLGDQVTVDDLVADGFPAEKKLRAGTQAALESVTRKVPELEDRTPSEDSDSDEVSAGSAAPPVDAVPEPPDAVPDAARRTESSSTPNSEIGAEPDEDDQQVPEAGRLPEPEPTDASEQAPVAGSAQAIEADPFAPEFLAPEPVPMPESAAPTVHSYAREGQRRSASYPTGARLLEPGAPEDAHLEPPRFEGRLAASPARGLATGHAASIPPSAAESTPPEQAESEFPAADEDDDPASRSGPGPSSFTDRWSSWIEPTPDRRPRPRPAQAPAPSRPTSWSTPTPEPQPLRRPTPTAAPERRPQAKPRGHRPQQIAAVALILLVIGTIWMLAASCSTPTGGAVQPTQIPVLTTEAVPPPPPARETPAHMNLLPLCTPFTPKC